MALFRRGVAPRPAIEGAAGGINGKIYVSDVCQRIRADELTVRRIEAFERLAAFRRHPLASDEHLVDLGLGLWGSLSSHDASCCLGVRPALEGLPRETTR